MLDSISIIDDFIHQSWWTRENSNVPYSIQNMNVRISEAATKEYWLTKVYDREIRDYYKKRLFHIHNLGFLGVYCVGWSIEDLLLKGFGGVEGHQFSKPAKHFRTALGQIYNFLYTLQGEAAGAQAFSNFDTYLAPFIHYDGLTQEEVDQYIQEFIFNMNVPTRVGSQTPFTNVTLDQQVPKFIGEDFVIIGGKHMDDTYDSFQDEMDMLNRAWWKQRIEGDGIGRPQPFPIETINVTKDFNWEDESLFKAVAMRGSPYFSNFVNSDMKPEDVRSMCCRLRIDQSELMRRGGGYFGSSPMTGSIGVVTINMPLIAYLSRSEDEFMDTLYRAMVVAKRSLELKRKMLEYLTKDVGLYPYSKFYLSSVFERFGEYWKNHFNTIGLVGMNEACLNLLSEDISTEFGLGFAFKVLEFMRKVLIEFQEETGNMYNLEATPAEGTSYRLALLDKKQYPDIITAGTKETPYYTNSTQLPVDLDKPLGFYLRHQNRLQPLYTGGTVFHIWNGETSSDWRAISNLIRNVAYKTKIPYYTYTPTTSICPTHGYMQGRFDKCPKCGSETEVWSRITGYFSPVKRWNDGKRQEFNERKHFSVSETI